MGKLIALLIFGPIVLAFPVAWSWMLLAGFVHAQLLPALIPAGFGAFFPPALLCLYVVALFKIPSLFTD